MKTITKALIAAILAITTSTANAVERFVRYDNGFNYTALCSTGEAMVDFINAKRAGDEETMTLMYRRECKKTSQGGLEFEIIADNRYISKIVFYDSECNLGTDEYFIDNMDIFSQTPKQMRMNGHKPPKCAKVAFEQYKARLNSDPNNFIVCNTLGQAKELAGMQDGWPKGCFAGAPTDRAIIKSIDGDYAQASFQQTDGSWTNDFWLRKDSFQ